MDNEARINFIFIMIFSITLILFSVYLIFAGQDSTSELTVNNTTIQEDSEHVFNFTINHSGSSAFTRNLTDINLSFPSVFTWTDASNGTGNLSSVDGYRSVYFFNDSTNNVLSWNGTTLTSNIVTVNATAGLSEGKNYTFISFNGSFSTPGKYNLTVSLFYNNTGIGNSTNHAVIVNDTTIPYNVNITEGRLLNSTYANISGSIVINVSVYDNGNFSLSNDQFAEITEVNISFYNASGVINASYNASNVTKASNDGSYWNVTVDTTTLHEGLWNISIFAKDQGGNVNVTNISNVLIDNTDPTATISCSPTSVNTGDTVTCSCSPTDSLSGIDTSATDNVENPDTSNTGVFTHGCSFVDLAGNAATVSTTYTVELSSSGGGTTSTPSFYRKTIPVSKDLEDAGTLNQKLAKKERIKFRVNDEIHYVGIRELTTTSATVEITSDPVQVKLDVGEDAKVDLEENGVYDIYVKLNAIINGKADLMVKYIQEEIPSDKLDEKVGGTGEVIGEEDEEEEVGEEDESNKLWLWGVIIALIAIMVLWFIKNKKGY